MNWERRAVAHALVHEQSTADVDGFNISHRVERGSCVAVGLSAMRVSQWLRPHAARCQNELDTPESALAGRDDFAKIPLHSWSSTSLFHFFVIV